MRKRWVSRDNVNVHRSAANIIVSKSRAARGSLCNVLLSGVLAYRETVILADSPVEAVSISIVLHTERLEYGALIFHVYRPDAVFQYIRWLSNVP